MAGGRSWTNDELFEEALKYNTKVSFKKESASAYTLSWRRGILNEVCSHMVSNGYRVGGFDFGGLEKQSGIYMLYSEGELVYIGKSHSCMATRIRQHSKEYSGYKKTFDTVKLYEIKNTADIFILEAYLVATLKPTLNQEFNTDDIPTVELNVNLDACVVRTRIGASFGVNTMNSYKGK